MLNLARSLAKHLGERALVASGVARAGRRFHRDSTVVLAYHNVLPTGASPVGDRSLHLARDDFARQLDLLVRTHRVVSFGELIRRDGPSVGGTRPAAVLTFDDAYRGALTAGLEELRRRDLPATFFVAPGRLGDRSFWWDQVAEAAGRLNARTRSSLLGELAGRQDRVEDWMRGQGLEPSALPAYARSVTEEELSEAAGAPGVTLGSHTWSHPHLPELARADVDQLEEELDASRQWLEERFPEASRPWLAYPYGAVSRRVIEAAAGAGYEHAAMVGGGLCPPTMPEKRSWQLPRLNVPAGLSESGFQLRSAGLFVT